jgi:hypothetical protein
VSGGGGCIGFVAETPRTQKTAAAANLANQPESPCS